MVKTWLSLPKRELKGTVGKNAEGRRKQLQKEINPWDFFM